MTTGLNCFEVRIGLMAFLLAASVGSLLNLAYGQQWDTTQVIQDSKVGTLMKHKGEFYCYDETTTEKKEVLKAIKNDWIDGVVEFHNSFLTSFMEDNEREMAEKLCSGLVENGDITNEDYHDEGIVLEGTLTMEFDWDD